MSESPKFGDSDAEVLWHDKAPFIDLRIDPKRQLAKSWKRMLELLIPTGFESISSQNRYQWGNPTVLNKFMEVIHGCNYNTIIDALLG